MFHPKKFKICLVSISSLVVLSFATPASSQPKINCANPGSNVEYKECAYRAYQASDKQLNRVYQTLLPKVKGTEKQKLIEAQSLWIKFRDANCDFEVYQSRNGSGYSGFLSNCLERMTKNRTEELANYYK
jgi:uncharacterized protein YecT (DUF1311 family)